MPEAVPGKQCAVPSRALLNIRTEILTKESKAAIDDASRSIGCKVGRLELNSEVLSRVRRGRQNREIPASVLLQRKTITSERDKTPQGKETIGPAPPPPDESEDMPEHASAGLPQCVFSNMTLKSPPRTTPLRATFRHPSKN